MPIHFLIVVKLLLLTTPPPAPGQKDQDHPTDIDSPEEQRPLLSSHSLSAITASALAPLIYRASPIDPALRPPSSQRIQHLSPFTTAPSADDRAPSPLPPVGNDISRPSSTSTQSSSAFLQHHNINNPQISLPGLSALASIASAPSPQLRAYNVGHSMTYATSSPAATTGGQGNTPLVVAKTMTAIADIERVGPQPVCQNCTTSTTPLWRRDEIGSVLCNACGLFLKLHGRPRPISLKTDVIKSRNRVKSAAQGPKKKSLFDNNGLSGPRSDAGTPPPGLLNHRRTSQKTSSGASDRSNSPVSRTETPTLHHPSNIAPQHLFDGVSFSDHGFHAPNSLPALHLNHPSPGSIASLNDRQTEPPQTYEGLLAANTTLKTRVSELEVINDLFRGRVAELEQNDVHARNGEMIMRETDDQLRRALDEAQRRENDLKRRMDELEREVVDLRDSEPRAKRMRLSDIVAESAEPPSQSATPEHA
ncbi:hypothetical protein MMC16_007252 [Acarospora aff. strigata]|nr:hypothetical protein [Acarospora aff. strigata]